MEILLGLGLAVVLLYFWLIGHWFARVLTTILFVPLFAFLGAALFASFQPPPNNGGIVILGAILGSVIAWFAASAPVYYWRRVLATVRSESSVSR
jgi:hypothetical protein